MAFYVILTEVPCVAREIKKLKFVMKKFIFEEEKLFFWPMLIHGSSRKNLPLLPYAKYDEIKLYQGYCEWKTLKCLKDDI